MCAVSSIVVGKRPAAVWNDEYFGLLRAKHGVPDDFLELKFGASNQMPNESKGGSPLYLTKDRQYVVKELSGGDHNMLMKCAKSYIDHVLGGVSLLSPIYLHFELPAVDSGSPSPSTSSSLRTVSDGGGRGCRRGSKKPRQFIAMRNLLSSEKPWVARYDLKGCADDKTLELDGRRIRAVHKRVWKLHMWCSCFWTYERWIYYEGKVRARSLRIDLPEAVRDNILRRINRDCDWLEEMGLMDYSLLVGMRRSQESNSSAVAPNGQSPAAGGSVASGTEEPVLELSWATNGSEVTTISAGIIDFLQPWTMAKRIAACIKSLEFNKATIPPKQYAARFRRHFAERLRAAKGLDS